MKKLRFVLALVIAIAFVMPAAADVTVGGEFQWYKSLTGTAGAGFPKVELNVTGMVDDYNTVKLELDSEGADFNGTVAVDDFRLCTDVSGALGVDGVAINTTIGFFDTYFTGWNYATRNGWDYYYNTFPYMGAPTATGALQLDLGFGDYTAKVWTDLFDNLMIGFTGSVADLGFFVTYKGATADLGGGMIWLDLGYSLDLGGPSLYIPAHFTYDLGASSMVYGAGAKFSMDMLSVGAGFDGTTADALDNVEVDVTVTPVDGMEAWVVALLDLGATEAFSGVEVGASYGFGAMTLGAGYVYGDNWGTGVWYDSFGGEDGLFLFADIDY